MIAFDVNDLFFSDLFWLRLMELLTSLQKRGNKQIFSHLRHCTPFQTVANRRGNIRFSGSFFLVPRSATHAEAFVAVVVVLIRTVSRPLHCVESSPCASGHLFAPGAQLHCLPSPLAGTLPNEAAVRGPQGRHSERVCVSRKKIFSLPFLSVSHSQIPSVRWQIW